MENFPTVCKKYDKCYFVLFQHWLPGACLSLLYRSLHVWRKEVILRLLWHVQLLLVNWWVIVSVQTRKNLVRIAHKTCQNTKIIQNENFVVILVGNSPIWSGMFILRYFCGWHFVVFCSYSHLCLELIIITDQITSRFTSGTPSLSMISCIYLSLRTSPLLNAHNDDEPENHKTTFSHQYKRQNWDTV